METKKLHDLSFEAICGIIAKVIHSANRAYVDAIGGHTVNLTWEEIREEERQGLIKAVSSMIIDPQTPSISHEQWCLAREKDGWSKDLKYDYNRKTHPNMVPYDQLPFEEQFKDHLFMGIASIFYGAMGLDDAEDVKAARAFIRSQLAIEDPHVDVKIDVEDDDDPVDSEATIILKEKIKATQAEIERLSGIPSDVRKDEEKPNLPDEPDQVINGVEKTYKPVMDIVDADGPDKPPPLPGKEGDLSRKVEGYVAGEEGYEDPNDNKLAVAPEMPLPSADEILDHKPKDYTVKDLAEDVLGANKVGIEDSVGSGELDDHAAEVAEAVMGGNPPEDINIKETTAKEEAEEAVGKDNVGEVPEGQGPKPGLPGKTIGPPKPNKTTAKKPAKKKSSK